MAAKIRNTKGITILPEKGNSLYKVSRDLKGYDNGRRINIHQNLWYPLFRLKLLVITGLNKPRDKGMIF